MFTSKIWTTVKVHFCRFVACMVRNRHHFEVSFCKCQFSGSVGAVIDIFVCDVHILFDSGAIKSSAEYRELFAAGCTLIVLLITWVPCFASLKSVPNYNATSPWSIGIRIRLGAGRSRVRLSARSNQDLVNWCCSLLTWCTVSRRVTGNTSRLQNTPSRLKPDIAQTQSLCYKTISVAKCHQQNTI